MIRFQFPASARSAGGSYYHRYEVLSFKPTKPARTWFADTIIRPQPGTVVENEITGRKYRLGDKKPEDIVRTLDHLIGQAKSRGFGARP